MSTHIDLCIDLVLISSLIMIIDHDYMHALKAPTQNLYRKADPCDVAADVSAVQTSERPTDTGSCIKRLVANKVSRSGATPP